MKYLKKQMVVTMSNLFSYLYRDPPLYLHAYILYYVGSCQLVQILKTRHLQVDVNILLFVQIK